jgi:hypothetical protein
MIDPKLCFSATNEIINIAKIVVKSFKPGPDYITESDLHRYISDEMIKIESACSSDVREGYTRHILGKFPIWISDEAYKRIRLEEIQSTLTKMRTVAKSHVQNIS